METIVLRSDFDVDLVEHAGSDEIICKAARVSTIGAASIDSKESEGLIKFLMSNRHGSPFEHALLMFRITAPIFVWREFMRHRIASYNEQSGRYMKLNPIFYVPSHKRKIIQIGKPGHYTFELGNVKQYEIVIQALTTSFKVAWESYEGQLEAGVANEVARMCLPVSIYSTAYVTMNPRGLMNFLSLRTRYDDSLFASFPMWEINRVADKMEEIFKEKFPITHTAFCDSGRVAP